MIYNVLLLSFVFLEAIFHKSYEISLIVAPVLAGSDIAVRFFIRQHVRLSIRASFRSQFVSTLAFKSIQISGYIIYIDENVDIICPKHLFNGMKLV